MTKYPFPHDLVHLQVNSDQNTQGKVYLKQETKKKLWFWISHREYNRQSYSKSIKYHENHEVLVICFP